MPITDRDNVVSIDAALAMLVEGETVHAFSNPGVGLLIGADWDRDDVEKAIREFGGAWVTGDMAQGMKHGIAVEQDGRIYFFETKQNADQR
jgi:hypothetical protein